MCELTPICAWKALVPDALPSAAFAPVAAEPAVLASPAAVVASCNASAVPFVRFATTLSIVEPLARETPSVESPVAVACAPAVGCCPPAMAATSDCDRKPKEAAVGSVASFLAPLAFPPITSSGDTSAVTVVAALALSAASACDCASASMKLGPVAVAAGAAPFLALDAEPAAVDWVWLDEVFCCDWALAAAFLPCVLDVALRFEVLLPDLAGLFAALRLAALLLEPLLVALLDPLREPAEAWCEDEEPDELPVLAELDEDDAEGAAAFGGGGATGVEIMDSRPTRGHSLRPDAL
jgi:hypothetical protein